MRKAAGMLKRDNLKSGLQRLANDGKPKELGSSRRPSSYFLQSIVSHATPLSLMGDGPWLRRAAQQEEAGEDIHKQQFLIHEGREPKRRPAFACAQFYAVC
jgi:hypothetical protein